MKEKRLNTFRKLIASGLLALLVFVYAEKFSHTHHQVSSSTEQPGYSASSSYATCSICDFTLAKDAALPEADSVNVIPVFTQQHFTAAVNSYHYLPERYISNKGPPAC